jgi:DHA1 family bicyclomycin/chloramphenicol resistance-like MFS transporter
MADIMSLIVAIFLLVPVFMPGVGQVILLIGPWQLVFVAMAGIAAISAIWAFLRLPESLARQDRRPLSFASVAEGFRLVLTNRVAISYGLSGLFLFGVILALVNTAQQIYVDIYGLGVFFPFAFAVMAGSAAIVSLQAPRIIDRVGLRRTAHGANLIFLMATTVWLLLAFSGFLPVWLFLVMVAIVMPTVVLTFSTTGALAMEPLGEVAGTASAVFGSMQTVGGAILGYLVAQAFDGTVIPVLAGLLVFGVCILATFLVAEKGRLFPAAAPTAAPP